MSTGTTPLRAPQRVSNCGCNRDCTGKDGACRLRYESVRFVRDGVSRLREPSACIVCASRLTCMWYGQYVLICLVSLFICLPRPMLRHLPQRPVVSMGARRASCAIVRRYAMYGIKLKTHKSSVHERPCSCVACTCEIDKGAFMYRRYTEMQRRTIMYGRLVSKVSSSLPSPVSPRVFPFCSAV